MYSLYHARETDNKHTFMRYIMQQQKDQENFLGRAGVLLGAFVSWWSRGHISVKIFTTMVDFVRKLPWSRRNQPW